MQRLSNAIVNVFLFCAPWALAGGIIWGLWAWVDNLNAITLFMLLAAYLAILFIRAVLGLLGCLLSLLIDR